VERKRFREGHNPIGFTPADALTTHRYSGEQTDRLTGLQYLRARDYNLATGTFMFGDNYSSPVARTLVTTKDRSTNNCPVFLGATSRRSVMATMRIATVIC
jgi:RHS repeat-associated protein